ncbi:hypothetical protein [Bradyrhizobium sp. STM 3562]|jgi:hypothetical protein|uniref:hypothetical protein n=1 Tax=Bradyrhizobium sp. STM 3562 TaxID=578924 RepID=UPI00388D13E2
MREILGLGVLAAPVIVLHVLAEQDDELDSLREIIGANPPAPDVEVQERSGVVAFPVVPMLLPATIGIMAPRR